jgi:hypothetical protein
MARSMTQESSASAHILASKLGFIRISGSKKLRARFQMLSEATPGF